jgi:excisionase family DNA binding protein
MESKNRKARQEGRAEFVAALTKAGFSQRRAFTAWRRFNAKNTTNHREGANHEDLLNYDEAAQLFRISPGTLRNWVCSQLYGLPVTKVGGSVRFRRESLTRWLESRERGMAQLVGAGAAERVGGETEAR